MGNYTVFRSRYRIWLFTVAIGVGILLSTGGISHSGSGFWNDLLSGPGPASLSPQKRALEGRKKAVESARAAFEKAKEAGAEYASPYEYYMAQEYLELAHDELKEGDRIGVHRFASESEQFSALAIRKSSGGGK
jgi:hypothetical protein